MNLASLGLEAGRAEEAGGEDSDEDPEDGVDVEVLGVVHDLGLARVVAWEEESPRAHEEVRADKRGSEEHDGTTELIAENEADQSHAAANNPPAPDSSPARGSSDDRQPTWTAACFG